MDTIDISRIILNYEEPVDRSFAEKEFESFNVCKPNTNPFVIELRGKDGKSIPNYVFSSVIFIAKGLANLLSVQTKTKVNTKKKQYLTTTVYEAMPPLMLTEDPIPVITEDIATVISRYLPLSDVISLKRTALIFSKLDTSAFTIKSPANSHLFFNLLNHYTPKQIASIFIFSPKIVDACIDLLVQKEEKNLYKLTREDIICKSTQKNNETISSFALANNCFDTCLACGPKIDLTKGQNSTLRYYVFNKCYSQVSQSQTTLTPEEQWNALCKFMDHPSIIQDLVNRGIRQFNYEGKNFLQLVSEESDIFTESLAFIPGIGEGFVLSFRTFISTMFSLKSIVSIILNSLIDKNTILTFLKCILLSIINISPSVVFVAAYVVEQEYCIKDYVKDIDVFHFRNPHILNILKSSEVTAPVINAIEERYTREGDFPEWYSCEMECSPGDVELIKDVTFLSYDSGILYLILSRDDYMLLDPFLAKCDAERKKLTKYKSYINEDTAPWDRTSYDEKLVERLQKTFPSLKDKISVDGIHQRIKAPLVMSGLLRGIDQQLTKDLVSRKETIECLLLKETELLLDEPEILKANLEYVCRAVSNIDFTININKSCVRLSSKTTVDSKVSQIIRTAFIHFLKYEDDRIATIHHEILDSDKQHLFGKEAIELIKTHLSKICNDRVALRKDRNLLFVHCESPSIHSINPLELTDRYLETIDTVIKTQEDSLTYLPSFGKKVWNYKIKTGTPCIHFFNTPKKTTSHAIGRTLIDKGFNNVLLMKVEEFFILVCNEPLRFEKAAVERSVGTILNEAYKDVKIPIERYICHGNKAVAKSLRSNIDKRLGEYAWIVNVGYDGARVRVFYPVEVYVAKNRLYLMDILKDCFEELGLSSDRDDKVVPNKKKIIRDESGSSEESEDSYNSPKKATKKPVRSESSEDEISNEISNERSNDSDEDSITRSSSEDEEPVKQTKKRKSSSSENGEEKKKPKRRWGVHR